MIFLPFIIPGVTRDAKKIQLKHGGVGKDTPRGETLVKLVPRGTIGVPGRGGSQKNVSPGEKSTNQWCQPEIKDEGGGKHYLGEKTPTITVFWQERLERPKRVGGRHRVVPRSFFRFFPPFGLTHPLHNDVLLEQRSRASWGRYVARLSSSAVMILTRPPHSMSPPLVAAQARIGVQEIYPQRRRTTLQGRGGERFAFQDCPPTHQTEKTIPTSNPLLFRWLCR